MQIQKKNCWRNHVSYREYREYTKTIRCEYYERGECRNGRWCDYKHLINTPCKYYVKGDCRKGDACQFRHMKQEKEIAPAKTNKEINTPIPQKDDDQKNIVEAERQRKLNFLKDTREMEPISTAVTQMMNSVEFERMVEKIIEKVIRGKNVEIEKQEEKEKTITASK